MICDDSVRFFALDAFNFAFLPIANRWQTWKVWKRANTFVILRI